MRWRAARNGGPPRGARPQAAAGARPRAGTHARARARAVTEELDPLVQVPDGIEPIGASRAWRCEVRDGRPLLRSVSPISRRSEWASDGWTRAECMARGARSR